MIFYIVFNQSMHCIVSTRARLVKMSPPFSNLLRPSIKPQHLGPIKIQSKSGNALKCSCIKQSHGGNTWLSRFPLKHSTTVDFDAVHVAFHLTLSINIDVAVFYHCNILQYSSELQYICSIASNAAPGSNIDVVPSSRASLPKPISCTPLRRFSEQLAEIKESLWPKENKLWL